eukprot:GHRR01020387.1.p1 GENE.GHRR01020387.1~~GHRR01020387.1.p1  ORF type:complete len:828 (+),score=374.04 GHRR01020387.1:716-3199(+)
MEAVESAVKDEVEAAAVVSATQSALAKTLQDLQALSGEPVTPLPDVTATLVSVDIPASVDGADSSKADVAKAIQLLDSLTGNNGPPPGATVAAQGAASAALLEAMKATTSSSGSSPPSSSSATISAASTASASAAGLAAAVTSLPAAAPKPVSSEQVKKNKLAAVKDKLLRVALFAASAALSYAFLQTAAGQSVLAAANDVGATIAARIPEVHIGPAERGLLETIWLLLTSIICVPAVCKLIPGGSPVLGYLIGGALVGPHALNIISDVHGVQHLAELGVVFLLFNIGLELSLDRLQSMAKYVFGMGAAQVVLTLLGVAVFAMNLAGLPGPSAIILGGALAMSTTAVAIQVLEDRGEMGSRHGRATFSVLLFQDLAVVVLLMLIPLLAPDPSGNSGGMAKIAQALGIAAVKAVVCIVGITAGGCLFIRPLYKKISQLANAEIFAATTLLVVLGISFTTQLAGLSLALGAFLAGLLLAETEYALQVESDIAPYKGLLMGLFFMTVGMQISVGLFIIKWKMILSAIVVLIAGKLAVMLAAGQMFGLSRLASLRSGMLLATGGEFAFVAFGEAVGKGVLPAALTSELYMVVALSMALVPYLAALGGKLGVLFERSDMKALQPQDSEVKELRNHVIIAGYGRVGQIIAQMLSELLIPFVALDVRSDRVSTGRAGDLPVYFGDAGSPAVLHSVGAERAACAVITLDTPGANYRSVWAMQKHFPHVKTYVRAHDINHGINLEKAGATVVVPETLEPSMQLAATVLLQFKLPPEEINTHLNNFRKKHLSELQALADLSGTTLGYLAPKKESRKEDATADDGDGTPVTAITVAAA